MKIMAGASLLQLYSALVYKGPALVGEILAGISAESPAAALSRLVAAATRKPSLTTGQAAHRP